MKKMFFFLFISLIYSFSSRAQDEENIFEKVEIEGGTDPVAWMEHVKKHTKLPDSLLKIIPAGTYRVSVQFVIDKNGDIGQIKALNNPGYGLAQRAENIFRSYKGKWRPALQCGRSVKSYLDLPVVFIIPAHL